MSESKTITLPSGKTAVIGEFKGMHIREAQRVSGGEQDKFLFALIAATTQIDGKPVVMEEMDEMDGKDVLALMGDFSENL
jgi:hypothetical protein